MLEANQKEEQCILLVIMIWWPAMDRLVRKVWSNLGLGR